MNPFREGIGTPFSGKHLLLKLIGEYLGFSRPVVSYKLRKLGFARKVPLFFQSLVNRELYRRTPVFPRLKAFRDLF